MGNSISYSGQKAVLYARVSSERQADEGNSIEAQIDLIKEYANKNGFVYNDKSIYIDEETAKSVGRTNYGQMIKLLKDVPDIKNILVEKTDRLYRNLRDYIDLEDLQLNIHLVKEGEVLNKESNSSAKFVQGIKALMAKHYVDNLSEEVKKGMNKKADKGEYPCKPPLGYIRNVNDHIIEVNEEVAPKIKQMFEAYATGNYSLSQLVKYSRDIGLKSVKGNDLIKAVVHKMLLCYTYTGNFVYNGKQYTGNHESIISVDLFNKVQEILKWPSSIRITKRNLPFQGFVKCGICGCSMTPDIKKGRYVYYRCTEYFQKCKNWLREESLVELLQDVINKIHLPKESADALRIALKESHSDKEQYHQEAIKSFRRQYHTLEQRKEKAYNDRLDGIIDEGFWKDTFNRITNEMAKLTADIKAHENANDEYLDLGNQLISLAQEAPILFEQQNNYEKREFINHIVSHSTYVDGSLCVTYKKPFNWFAEGTKTINKRG